MPTKDSMVADAEHFSARHGIDFGSIIRIGAAVVSAVLALQGGAPVTETVKVHGELYDITIQRHAG